MLEQKCLDDVLLIVQADDFYLTSNQLIFAACVEMQAKNKAIDAVTLGEWLERKGQLAEAGGADYLQECFMAVPYSAHAKYYAEIVADKAKLRAVINAASDAIREAYDDTKAPDEIAAAAESGFHRVMERGLRLVTNIGDLLMDAIHRLTTGKRMGIATGFSELDKMLYGMQPGALLILAARPSVGKTSLAMKIIFNAAKHGVGGLLLSLEQTELEIAEKLLALESGIGINEARDCHGDESTCGQLMDAAHRIDKLPIVIDDTAGRTVEQMAAVMRIQQRKKKIQFVVIDYLQLVRASDGRAPREQQVAHVSRSLKEIAKSCGVPIVCLAQLNRDVEKRDKKTPRLSDLRESGAIEQDADVVMFLDRPCLYDDTADVHYAKLIVAKNRSGKIGEMPLHFRESTTDFVDAATHAYQEAPEFESSTDEHWQR